MFLLLFSTVVLGYSTMAANEAFTTPQPHNEMRYETCQMEVRDICWLPDRFSKVVDKYFYRKFVDADGVPIMSSEEVQDATLMNMANLIIKVMRHLHPDVRAGVLNRNQRIAVVAKSQTFCQIPEISFHHYLAPGKPCSQPHAHGVTFKNLIIVTEDIGGESTTSCDYRNSAKAGRVLLHEFGHGINFAIDEKVEYLKTALDTAYDNAQRSGYLSELKDPGRPHYFVFGYLAYINANECNLQSYAPRERVCSKKEFQSFDINLYRFVESVFPSFDWTYTCSDVCDPTKITRRSCV